MTREEAKLLLDNISTNTDDREVQVFITDKRLARMQGISILSHVSAVVYLAAATDIIRTVVRDNQG